jgi:hypothetical protein
MKTVLISTTSLWNFGDDFIREGVLELLCFRPDVRLIWWNRGYGIKNTYANSLNINLPLIDYFIAAGSPEWMYKNENIYKYCLEHKIPFSIIGVGTRNVFGRLHFSLIRKIAQSELCEVAFARDESALKVFREFGFQNIDLIPDPAFFAMPIDFEEKINFLGWRDNFIDYEPSFLFRYPHRWLYKQVSNRILRRKLWGSSKRKYDKLMQEIFCSMPEPKMVIVHDNREVQKAERLFGAEYVFYSSDYRRIFEKYSQARIYIGSRIHGAIPSLIHGASAYLIYSNPKAKVLETSIDILSRYSLDISQKAKVYYLEDGQIDLKKYEENSLDRKIIAEAISREGQRIREILKKQSILRDFIL